MSPGPRKASRRTHPNIQKQLDYHVRARQAVLKWKALTDAGKLKEAKKMAREALRLEAEWRKYGGTGPLT